jgi:hypothetical protein
MSQPRITSIRARSRPFGSRFWKNAGSSQPRLGSREKLPLRRASV